MKKGFILYLDSLSVLDELDDKQTAILFRALRDYNLGKEPELDFAMRMAFLPFKNQFIRDNEEYQKTCERNRNNGSKGGRPKNPTEPTETQKTHSVLDKPKKADKDKDTDKEKESIEVRKSKFYDSLSVYVSEYPKQMLRDFFDYWTEHGVKDTKMRFEKEKTFGISQRLKTWYNRNPKQYDETTIVDPLVEYVYRKTGLR